MSKFKRHPREIDEDRFSRVKKKKPKIKNKKAKIRITKAERIAYLKSLPYADFLQTRYWKQVRSLVLERDGKKCVICKSEKYLQVHHDTYKHHGDELNHLTDLMTLCKDCHKEHHQAQK